MLISGLFSFLDCHQVWQSHDPTSVQNFDFCEKVIILSFLIFFKKTQLFFLRIYFLGSLRFA